MIDDVPDPRLGEAYAHCEQSLREGDPDRWLACLFAPATLRPHLHALYAFSLDVARIRDIVSDPISYQITQSTEGRGYPKSRSPTSSLILYPSVPNDTKHRRAIPEKSLTDVVSDLIS